MAKQKFSILCAHLKIAENSAEGVTATLSNQRINDFEDGLEYYAAVATNCDCIVTEDISDFYFSELEVLSCKDFFEKYLR